MKRPEPSSEHVRRRFERQKRADTEPEMALRRRLHALGFRYRVDCAVLPGSRRRADLAFLGPKVAVFVDGCFWHRCPQHGNLPKNNRRWWKQKLDSNVERDRDTDARLDEAGWVAMRIWEHEIRSDVEGVVERVASTVRTRTLR